MAIYYTCIPYDRVKKFPEKVTERKAIEELENNQTKDKETEMCLSTFCGWTVYSVFFVRGRRVMRIWDSHINGFRLIKDKMILPNSIK